MLPRRRWLRRRAAYKGNVRKPFRTGNTMADAEKTKTAAAAPAPATGGVMDKVNEFLDRPVTTRVESTARVGPGRRRRADAPASLSAQVATIGDAIEKITHTGAHAADAKVEPGAPASGSPKVVEGEVVKPPPS